MGVFECITSQGCNSLRVAESISKVLSLQRLLFQSDVMELFDAGSTSEWVSGEQEDTATPEQQEGAECEHTFNQYFCGDTRAEPSDVLKAILKRSCHGDLHKQGSCGHSAGCKPLLDVACQVWANPM